MIWYQALVLGLIQGLTEFLPISSSGHLILIPNLFGWEVQSLTFDVVLHLGTAFALIAYFWKDLNRIVKAFIIDRSSHDGKLGLFILLGTIPAVVLGLLFGSYIEFGLRMVSYVVVFLAIGTTLMILAEVVLRKSERAELTLVKSLVIGIFQSLALFPGVSRSGATISGGMMLGLDREQAARFSFLLSIPVVIGAAGLKIYETFNSNNFNLDLLPLLIGFFISFFVGFLAIDFMLRFLKSGSLFVFVLYRLFLIALLIVFL